MVKMSTVWDRTAEFLTDNLQSILPIALLAYFVPLSISGNFESAIERASFQLELVLRLVSLAFSLLAMWGSLAIAAMVLDTSGREPGSVAARRLPAALAATLTMLAGFALLLLPVPLGLSATGHDMDALARAGALVLAPAVAWPLALYLLLVTAAMLWAVTRLVVLNPVVVAEKRALGAIGRSWRLTRGLGLPIFGVLLLYAMVATVAVLATNMVFGSIFQLVAGPGAADSGSGVSLPGVLTSVMVAAVQTLFTVVVPVFTSKLYLALTAAERERPAAP